MSASRFEIASEKDISLIRWVADAHVGDLLPEPYRGVRPNGTFALIRRLVELGVMAEPSGGSGVAEVAGDAQVACRDWLAAEAKS